MSAALSLGLSFLAKYLADTYLHVRVPVVGSFAGLDPVQNPGVAFGLRLPTSIQGLVILIALTLVCVIAWKSRRTGLDQLGYGLIVGGALGNVLDRVRDGLVTDFIQVGTFPVFNVADSCITIGVVLLLAEMVRLKRNQLLAH